MNGNNFSKQAIDGHKLFLDECYKKGLCYFYLLDSDECTSAVFIGQRCPNPSDPAIAHSISVLEAGMKGRNLQIDDMSCEVT